LIFFINVIDNMMQRPISRWSPTLGVCHMTENTIAVFTARSPQRIVEEGGSQAWVLNPLRAKQCTWLVCTQNQHNPDHAFSDATEPHGSAFLVGKISGIVQEDGPDVTRWKIAISEFARVAIPDLWKGWRNPVRYTSLEELGINVEGLEFEALKSGPTTVETHAPRPRLDFPKGLTIAAARAGLAATLGVSPDAIDITIRA